MKTRITVLLDIELSKPIQEITDLIADRVYRMDGVEDVTASIVEEDIPAILKKQAA